MNGIRFSSNTRDTLKRTLVLALLFGAALYVLAQLGAPGKIAYAAGTISGTAFRDYDGDGVQDTAAAPIEPGVGGITVTAYPTSGSPVSTTTFQYVCASAGNPNAACTGAGTPALGSYSLDTTGTSGPYRIEFTGAGSNFYAGEFGSGTSGNKTSVRFLSDGTQSNINFAVSDPSQYVNTTAPTAVTNAYAYGASSGSGADVLFSHAYTTDCGNPCTTTPTLQSEHQHIGAVWGLAYRRTSNHIFAAAYVKRNSGFGPGMDGPDAGTTVSDGSGTIYRVVPGGTADGTAFVDIDEWLGGNLTGNSLHGDTFSCTVGTDNCDGFAFANVGKAGLGDLELSGDETKLFTISLFNSRLYEIGNLDAASQNSRTVTDRGAIPAPADGCTNGTARPFGLGWKDGLLYIGGVCDAASGTTANLDAYVITFNPTDNTFNNDEVIRIDLNYPRECADRDGSSYASPMPACDSTGDRGADADWRVWTDSEASIAVAGAFNASDGFGAYPMPMLTDIVFDGETMILGLRDRGADMLGIDDPGPGGSNPRGVNLNAVSPGDILRANPNGSATRPYWNIENNTQSNPTGIFGPASYTNTAATPDIVFGQSSGEGPGSGEFYYAERWANNGLYGDNGTSFVHAEISLGGLAQGPGLQEVILTAIDPWDITSGGTIQLSNVDDHASISGTNNDGERVREFEIYEDGGCCTAGSYFSKANGLGDLELIFLPAPLEIGNRVWRDDDGDGIQDPNEMPIAGLTVRLMEGTNVIGTTTTDANGEWYFNSATVGNWGADGIPNSSDDDTETNGLKPSTLGLTHNYEIRIETGRGSNTNLLNGLTATTANAAQPANGNASATNNDRFTDVADSDASYNGTYYVINYTTGGIGSSNHSLDFGFAPLGSIGNRVWIDEDSNGIQDEGEDGIANVTVTLYNSSGTALATKVTDANGYYLFTGLAAGTYFVRVTSGIPSGMTQTDITINPNPGVDLFNQDQSTGTDDYGYQVTLSAGQDNLTADFGYNWNPSTNVNSGTQNATAALGDRVWIDNNGNGRQDAGEVGVNNVTVSLYRDTENDGDLDDDDNGSIDAENLVSTTTTDQNGYYIFDGLTPGAYTVQVTGSGSASHNVLNTSQFTQTGDPDHYGTTGTNNDNRTTTAVILGPGDVFLDADFGYDDTGITLGSIGNFVWYDRDADDVGPTNAPGGGDTTEVGIGGVSVALIRDLDADGVWDSNEPIIASMFTSNGSQDVDNDGTTDPLGYYNFRGLQVANGTGTDDYLILVTDVNRVLDGLTQTYDADGSQSDNMSIVTNLTTTAVTSEDFGYTPDNSGTQASRTTLSLDANTGTIGNFVWFDMDGDANGPNATGTDTNGDGSTSPETGEVGIPNVRVYLYQDSNNDGDVDAGEPLVATTYTGPDGYYLFTNLTTTDGAGTDDYVIVVDTSTLPGGLAQTYDNDGSLDGVSRVSDLTTTPVLTEDFGYRGSGTLGSIGNLVWNDVNADGNVDAGESGIGGVTVDLYFDTNGNGKIDPGEPRIATQTTSNGSQDVDNDGSTDAIGFYRFRNLPTDDGAGTNAQYIVDVSDRAGVLAGYWHSLGNQSSASDNESKTDPYAVTLTPSTPDVTTVDFGYYVLPGAVGNYVWDDANGDGIQDAGESGINGVVVQLTITYPGPDNAIGGGDDTVTTIRTVTGDNPNQSGTQTGWYSFANLLQDEDYNGANSANMGEPSFSISVVTAEGTGALTDYAATAIDQGGDDKLDSDDPAGVTASATEGVTGVNQTSPASDEGTQASYDFGYTKLDYGDAPNSYRTTYASNGPRHFIASNIRIGTVIDADNGTLTNTAATADNLNNQNDENTITSFPYVTTGMTSYALNDVSVLNNTGSTATLYAWVDFDRDGAFEESERTTVSVPSSGSQQTVNLSWTNLSGVVGGATYARFRLTTGTITGGSGTGDALASGWAPNGEVEDYQIPAAPTNLELSTVNAEAAPDGTVIVRWETGTELQVLGFNILRAAKRNGKQTAQNTELIAALSPGQVTGNAYEFTDSNVKPGKTYFYRIEVVRADNTSEQSEAVKVKTGENTVCQGKPDKAVLLAPENDSKQNPGKLTFSWDAVNCAATYQVQIRLDSPKGELVVESKSLTKTQFSTQKLEKGKTYVWRVLACNADGKCSGSEWWSFKVAKKVQQ